MTFNDLCVRNFELTCKEKVGAGIDFVPQYFSAELLGRTKESINYTNLQKARNRFVYYLYQKVGYNLRFCLGI